MAVTVTAQRVLDMAPDASSAKAGQGLARAAKWKTLGHSDRAVWGEIQGSGKNPYQTRVDLNDFATKCSCPSRKFPCKHALGLLLVLAESPDAFGQEAAPGWVAEWIVDRDERQEKKAEKAASEREVIADPAARARRIKNREEKIRAGLDELSLWLSDLVRQGLGTAQTRPSTFWESMGARMVDAQAPGLARLVRGLATSAVSGEGWQERLLMDIGRVYLAIEAYGRLDRLPPETQADVRALVGWTVGQEELLPLPSVRDEWLVVGQVVETEDKLRIQRTWLYGRRVNRPALILQFAAGAQPFEGMFVVGTSMDADLAYYPGACPLRAAIRDRHGEPKEMAGLPGVERINESLKAYAGALARYPWLERWPMALAGVIPEFEAGGDAGGRWFVRDADNVRVPIETNDDAGWQLMAIGGGRAVGVFGEWNGQSLGLFSVASEGRFFTMTRGEASSVLARVC